MILLLCILLGMYVLRTTATVLNLRALSPAIPPEFAGTLDPAAYARSQDYSRVKERAGLVEDAATLAAFLVFWLAGGFAWLHGWTAGLGLGPVATGLVAVTVLVVLQWLVGLPFDLHHTFVIEERFGFNRTAPATYVLDQLKAAGLGIVFGLPLLAAILWILREVPNAWLWAWATVAVWSLFLTFIAPSVIMPLFNKFTPLADGPLRSGIDALARRCGFPLAGVSVMDGSKRSSKANAFFTGFGRHRRIALFDTLVERHDTDELLAVLAHEIGHFKKHHIWQQMAGGLAMTFVLFLLLGWVLRLPPLYEAFGLEIDPAHPPVHFGLVFFLVFFRPMQELMSVARYALSRKHEFEADAFASEATGGGRDLAKALRRLSTDSLSNLTPHPLEVWLHHTHPPVVLRLRALAALPDRVPMPASTRAQQTNRGR